MTGTTTPTYQENLSYDRGSSNVVSPLITLAILIAGVIGGLVIVVAFILFCKYCVKKTHVLRRDVGTDCERSSDRRFKPFQRYETINSDIFSEPSTGSMDGIPVSPRKLFETKSHEKLAGTDEVTETTRLKSDFDKSTYRDVGGEEDGASEGGERRGEGEEQWEGDDAEESEHDGRRVSFQVDNSQQTPTSYLRKGRRYTEGDFHYLKKIRVDKRTPYIPRQYSLGAPLMRDSNRNIEVIELTPISSAEESLVQVPMGFKEYESEAHAHALSRAFNSPSPTSSVPLGTQVAVDVEVHHGETLGTRTTLTNISKLACSPRNCKIRKNLKPHSSSLDIVSPTDLSARTNRRVKSYDDVADYDYDVLKITEFSKGPFYNNDFEVITEIDTPSSSKVRYNDMGSLEVLNEDKLDYLDDFEFENIIPDESDDTETLNGTQKYRELWNLRTTLEEEEECSDTIRMEDMASPDDQSPEGEHATSYLPFYDVNSEAAAAAQFPTNHKAESPQRNADSQRRSSCNFLHPNYDNNPTNRRESYKKILTRRFQKKGSTSAENSFDSVETVDTDGDVSDTSRHEVTTTSFESTTDNTDSTNDSQTNRLRQMKADSGYKSLETQQPPGTGSNGVKKSQSMDDEITVLESSCAKDETFAGVGTNESVPRRTKFEKRNGRTASKRRREYSRERQAVRLYDSIHEPETGYKSDQPSGDSFEEPNVPSKFSVFSRFFRSQKHSRERSLTRDFSIDEKSNDIFQEFVRHDPEFDGSRGSTAGLKVSPNRQHRLTRKFTDPGPGVFEERGKRDRLVPEMRSTSLGSDSSASSARRISPHDSIEEEEFEDDIDAAVMSYKCRLKEETRAVELPTPTVSIHEIPIIRLPEGEAADV